jgi:hypothetical protein
MAASCQPQTGPADYRSRAHDTPKIDGDTSSNSARGFSHDRPRRLRAPGARDRRRPARPWPGACATDERAAGRGASDQRDDHGGAGQGARLWCEGAGPTRCSPRRRCPTPSTAHWTRWPNATTCPCRWVTSSTALRKGAAVGHHDGRLCRRGEGGRHAVCAPSLPRCRSGLGPVAPGAGRPIAEPFQGRAEEPIGPTGGRPDVHELGSCAANRRRHLHSESAGGLRGHRRPAARRGSQEDRGGGGFTRIGPDEVDERIETGPLRISSRFKSGVLE